MLLQRAVRATAFNSPPLMIKGPALLGLLFLVPVVIWSLAGVPFALMFPSHSGMTDMGPEPQTVLAFSLVAGVWTLIAVGVSTAIVRFSRQGHSRNG